jgi:hypothetical protein
MIREMPTTSSTPSTNLVTSGAAVLFFVSAALSSMYANVKRFTDVNTTSDELKTAVVRSIKAGQPVFFGCDVGQFSSSLKDVGVMDTAYHQYEVNQLCLAVMLNADSRGPTLASIQYLPISDQSPTPANQRVVHDPRDGDLGRTRRRWAPDSFQGRKLVGR